MKRFLMVLFGMIAGVLFCEEIDFNKSKLEKLTKELGLSKEQAMVMKKIIAEDTLFAKEGLTIKPDMETIDDIIDTRCQRISLLFDRVKETLTDTQYNGYLKYKAGIVTDKAIINLSDKLSLSDVQKIMVSEMMSLVKKMKSRDTGRMPPSGGMNGGPGMGGGMESGEMGMGPSGGQRGGMQNGNSLKNDLNPLIEIFESNLNKLLTDTQSSEYLNIQKSLREELKKIFPSNEKDTQPGQGMGPGMGGGGGPGMGGNGGGMRR